MFLSCIKGWKKETPPSNSILSHLFCFYNLMASSYNCDVMLYPGLAAYPGPDVGEGEITGGSHHLAGRQEDHPVSRGVWKALSVNECYWYYIVEFLMLSLFVWIQVLNNVEFFLWINTCNKHLHWVKNNSFKISRFCIYLFLSLHEFDNCQVLNRKFFFKIKNNSVQEIHLFKLYPSIRYRIKILRLNIMAKNTVIV